MPLSKKLALETDQIEEIMTGTWNCRIATIGPGSHERRGRRTRS